jgi:hypothetical protein
MTNIDVVFDVAFGLSDRRVPTFGDRSVGGEVNAARADSHAVAAGSAPPITVDPRRVFT